MSNPNIYGRGGSPRVAKQISEPLWETVADAPGGGGSISVTDGRTTVDPASSLSFPAGTLTDAGGGVASLALSIRLLVSALITKDTPLLSSDSGEPVVLFSVANGDLAVDDLVVDLWAEVLEFFDGPDNAQLHIRAISGGQQADLLITTPDLAFSNPQNNSQGTTPGLGSTDQGGRAGMLDVRSNAANDGTLQRVLPARVTASDLVIGVNLAAGTTWTQGQMYIYAIIARAAS